MSNRKRKPSDIQANWPLHLEVRSAWHGSWQCLHETVAGTALLHGLFGNVPVDCQSLCSFLYPSLSAVVLPYSSLWNMEYGIYQA